MSDILQILVTNFGGLCRELANDVCREMNQKKKKILSLVKLLENYLSVTD